MLRAALEGLGPAWAGARRRLAAWPHWVWPLAVCAVFSAAGILVLDDYAVTSDTVFYQRPLAVMMLDFALGDADALPDDHNKFYGAAFEVLPLLVERVAGLDDTRAIYLTRHLMTHLFFISAGFCCYLLAYRMTGSRLLGLFAMLLFLLHPRMYGHSYFNSKDLPFLSMFIIALFSVHWAFRKGTITAFVLCGAAVAILVNLRIMGVMLLPAVLAMRAADLYFAGNWAERRRVMSGGAAFALAAAGIYYASMPYLWADPLDRFGELLTTLSSHPGQFVAYPLFQGEYFNAGELPARFVPVWIGITTPPWALLLAGLGAVSICWRAARRAGAALRNGELRFELLALGCAALPVAGIVIARPVMYDDWRQVYFLWAPLCLLATLGLRQVGNGLGQALAPRPAMFLRWGLAGLAAIAIASVVVTVVRLHPYQYLYFNFLVDRTAPENLKTQYIMEYLATAGYEGYKYIMANHPGYAVNLTNTGGYEGNNRNLEIFPESIRRRISFNRNADADYYVLFPNYMSKSHFRQIDVMMPPVIYSRKMYNSTAMIVTTPHLSRVDASAAAAYREIYQTATRGEPARRGWFDWYLHEKTLTLVMEDCEPGILNGPFLLHVYPADRSDLPHYYHGGRLSASLYGVRFDGRCLMQATLPDFDLARITGPGGAIVPDDYLRQLRRQYAALQATEPAIRAGFAVYIRDGALYYIRDECGPADTAAPFYLQLIPAAADHLPAAWREYGYDGRSFSWDDLVDPVWHDAANRGLGFTFDGKCMAMVWLPDYEIAGIRTGQYLPGAGRLWSGEFYTAAYLAARASELAAQAVGEPAAQDFFSVYHGAGALTYIRENCAPADTDATFYLHLYPADAAELPAGQREYGFDNRDFEFAPAGGVQYEGRCLARISLPDYAIDRIHTGQYSPATGRLWAAEFDVDAGLRERK